MPDLRYRGVASVSELLLVKTGGFTDQLVDALVWIAQVASETDQPVSVNVSLGSHYGAHDGSRADELAIDALSGPGFVVTCAAGNSDGLPLHATGSVPQVGAVDSVRVVLGDYPQGPLVEGFGIDLWYPAGCSLAVGLRDPGESWWGPVTMGDTLRVDGPSGCIWVANATDRPLNGDYHAVFLVTDEGSADSVAAGEWLVRLEGSGTGAWDAWLFFRSHGATAFLDPDSSRTLVMPGTASRCLTVGGFDRDTGEAYAFSSRGPTRDGRAKPQLCAPTSVHTATPGGGYAVFSGTSASAPHVAGAVALAMGRWGPLTPEGLRATLSRAARVDPLVALGGALPSDKWGCGKLYVEPLVRSFSVTGIAAGAEGVGLSWEVAAGASRYEVYRDSLAYVAPDTLGFSNRAALVAPGDDLGEDPGIQWTDTTAVVAPGRLVCYVVRACKGVEAWWSTNRVGVHVRATGGDP